MRAILVRAGIDQAFGGWNAPVDPTTNEFVYVPIPEDQPVRPGMSTPYASLRPVLAEFAGARACADRKCVLLPDELIPRNMHLDPDFSSLTYGDNGRRRGKGLTELTKGSMVVFYAGLRPCRPSGERLRYSIIGVYSVAEVVHVGDIERLRWSENAHTRRRTHRRDDVVVRATAGSSGRLRRCIPIGEWRAGAYRVREDLLSAWGGLSCRDGFIQRSAVPPTFHDPLRFLKWLDGMDVQLISQNDSAVASER